MKAMKKQANRITLNTRYIGVYIPAPFEELLSLYCVSEQISKSSFIRELIRDWYEIEKDRRKEIREEIKRFIHLEWEVKKREIGFHRNPDIEIFKAFKEQTKSALIQRGLTPMIAENIVITLQI